MSSYQEHSGCGVGFEKTCPICEKIFFLPPGSHENYAYQHKGKGEKKRYFCSWTCYRIDEKERKGVKK